MTNETCQYEAQVKQSVRELSSCGNPNPRGCSDLFDFGCGMYCRRPYDRILKSGI